MTRWQEIERYLPPGIKCKERLQHEQQNLQVLLTWAFVCGISWRYTAPHTPGGAHMPGGVFFLVRVCVTC